MSRYAIVIQSTDMRRPNSKVRFTRSLKKAMAEKRKGGGYTYKDPEAARNWHHDFVYVYELPKGWRRPSINFLRQKAREQSTSTYPRTPEDILANIIWKEGIEVVEEVDAHE